MKNQSPAQRIELALRNLLTALSLTKQAEYARFRRNLSNEDWRAYTEADELLGQRQAEAVRLLADYGRPFEVPLFKATPPKPAPQSTPEIDARCADLLGWHRGIGGAIIGGAGFESPTHWYSRLGQQMAPALTDSFANLRAWSPATYPEDARPLRDEVERRELQGPFVRAMVLIIKSEHGILSSWLLLRARPDQIARAFVVAAEQAPTK